MAFRNVVCVEWGEESCVEWDVVWRSARNVVMGDEARVNACRMMCRAGNGTDAWEGEWGGAWEGVSLLCNMCFSR